jgi:hypothetical protein
LSAAGASAFVGTAAMRWGSSETYYRGETVVLALGVEPRLCRF